MKLVSGNPGLGLGESDARYLRLTGGTLAGNLNVGSGRIVATAPAGTIPQSGNPSPGQTLEHTWNGAGNTWTAFELSVTDTASASASKLLDLKVNGTSKVNATKSGGLFVTDVYPAVNVGVSANDGLNIHASASSFISDGVIVGSVGNFLSVSGFCLSAGYQFNWGLNSVNKDTGLGRTSAGLVEVNNGTANTLRDFKCRRATVTEYQEVLVSSEPSAPTSGARLWADLSGGKVFLMARFPTGASQVVAQEP